MILGLTQRIIVVDAETCSKVDLKAHGAARYFADPSTRTLMVGLQEYGQAASAVWQPRLGAIPTLLTEAAAAPPSEVLFAAFNAPFDQRALAQAGLSTPTEKWVDIMLLSYMLSFAGGLDQVLKAFDVGAAKAPEGKALIKRFSVLRQPWYDAPEEWSRFVGYCEQDVRVETQLLAKCCHWLDQPAFHPMVREVQDRWLLDQAMNQRGMPVRLDTLNAAIHLKNGETKRLMDEMRALSGLDNPNSVQQLLAWVQAQGVPLGDLQAPNVKAALLTLDPDTPAAQVLSARLRLGKTSVKKFDAMHRMHVNGRLHDGYVTYGASRTGRTASRGINLSNLERPKLADPETAADLLETRDPFLVASFLPHRDQGTQLMDVLGSCVRATLAAPPGKGIGAIDLKSIESVGVSWLAGCDSILDLFFSGRDSYKDFATRYFGVAYEDVTSEQRKFCKPACLGASYGASGGALQEYAKGLGVEMSDFEAQTAVDVFRANFWEIPALWKSVDLASKSAVRNPGQTYRATAIGRDWPYVQFYCDGTFLLCGLPSGRTLFYYKPRLETGTREAKDGRTFQTTQIRYMGKKADESGGWYEVYTQGPKLVENITQGICCDVLYHGVKLTSRDAEIEIIGTTYDELIFLTELWKDQSAIWKRLHGYVTTRPPWADDRFFLGADGYIGVKRYRKD